MSTAIVPLPTSPTRETPYMALRFPAKMSDWTLEHRRRAAKWGWAKRKDPRHQTIDRFNLLLKTADRTVLRLYACDLAGRTLPVWEAHYPGDARLAALHQIARRYALGEANDDERLAASRLVVMVCRSISDRRVNGQYAPAYAAANAVGFCLWRAAGEAPRHTSYWAADALGEDDWYKQEGAQRLVDEVEARLAASK